MIKIGLTGGIATGKTTVANIMQKLGTIVIDADKIAHEFLAPNTEVWNEIVNEFGKDILLNDNYIDRKKLGNIVFNDYTQLTKLNQILHPKVINETKSLIKEYELLEKERKRNYILVLVVPLLFETNTTYLVDYTVVVKCSEQNQINRLILRNNLTQKEAIKRINAQMPLEEKVKLADFVIDNDGDINKLEPQIKNILNKWEWNQFIE